MIGRNGESGPVPRAIRPQLHGETMFCQFARRYLVDRAPGCRYIPSNRPKPPAVGLGIMLAENSSQAGNDRETLGPLTCTRQTPKEEIR